MGVGSEYFIFFNIPTDEFFHCLPHAKGRAVGLISCSAPLLQLSGAGNIWRGLQTVRQDGQKDAKCWGRAFEFVVGGWAVGFQPLKTGRDAPLRIS